MHRCHLLPCPLLRALQDLLVRVMTDASQDADSLLSELPEPLHADQLASLLALRGMLAHGLLAHALQKRHGVDYGVDR